MPRNLKPVALCEGHRTKAELEARMEAEDMVKGSSERIEDIPQSLTTKKEKEVYLQLVEELKQILTNIDSHILTICVDSIIQMDNARKLIRKYGSVVDTMGQLKENPAVKVYMQYEKVFIAVCKELCLSPVSRQKLISLNLQSREDEDDELVGYKV